MTGVMAFVNHCWQAAAAASNNRTVIFSVFIPGLPFPGREGFQALIIIIYCV